MKMKFNRENYEAFVLDYLEGKLTDTDRILFLKFLKENPDIYAEVEEISSIQLQPANIQFSDKNSLKKTANTTEFDNDFNNSCIAYIEGDLEPTEKQKFESWLSENPGKSHEFDLFRKVYLKADTNVIFAQKSRLKKLTILQKRIRLYSVISAAASIAIFLIIFITSNERMNSDVITKDTGTGFNNATETDINSGDNQSSEAESSNVLAEEKQTDLIQDFEPTDSYRQANNYNQDKSHNQDENNSVDNSESTISGRENILIEPVSLMLAKVENRGSVNYKILKQSGSEPSMIFDDYQTLGEFASNQILRNLFPEDESDKLTKMTFWALASGGLEALNSITNGGYDLDREMNENGSIKRISLETPLLGFSIPIKNKQSQ